jgi:molecular chaperone GrpE
MEDQKIEEVTLTEDETGTFQVELDEETLSVKDQEMERPLRKDSEEKTGEKNWKEKYLYLRADFENYKKRVVKDQLDQSRFANEKLLKEVLVVLDNIERALLHFNESHDFEQVSEGLVLISKQFLSLLNRFGVSPVKSLNKPFDPACHQAVGHLNRPDIPEGEVAEEVQKGYMLYDRLIRPSFVMISKRDTVLPFVVQANENNPPLGGTVDSNI